MTIKDLKTPSIYQAMAVSKPPIYRVLVLLLVLTTCYCTAQNTHSRLPLQGRLSLDSLTNYVHSHTGIRFSFNSGKIKGNTIVAFPKGVYSIDRILQHIHQTTGLYYQSYKNYIIFREKPFKTPAAPVASTHPAVRTTTIHHPPVSHTQQVPLPQPSLDTAKKTTGGSGTSHLPRLQDTATAAGKLTLTKDTLTPNNTVTAIQSNPPSGSLDTTIHIPPVPRAKDTLAVTKQLQRPPVATDVKEPASRKPFHAYVQAGVFATEVLYANAGIEAGIRPIHLLLSWATDFHISGPRIGLGSIIKTDETTQWQVNASVCFLQTDYVVDSLGTGNALFTVKGKLYSTGVNWCKQVGEKWVFKAGLSLNLLSSVYYKNGNKASINGWLYNANPDKILHLLNLNPPPLLVTNNFNRTSPDNIKTWVGLSIGFYYQL